MAGGVWYLREWDEWIDNPELGPVAFQFGTRPLLTQESPISDAWKRKLLTLQEGDVFLNRSQPDRVLLLGGATTISSRNCGAGRERQVAYSVEPVGEHDAAVPRRRPRPAWST